MATPSGIIAVPSRRAATFALAAAVLFGIGAPVGKLLVEGTNPVLLAGILYLGAGLALAVLGLGRRLISGRRDAEAPLRLADLPALIGMTLCGGVLGPVLLLYGLSRASGLVASLLMNLEAVFTLLLAMALGEHVGRAQLAACALITAGAAVLTIDPTAGQWSFTGALAVALACLCWAADNNLARHLSLRDPVALVRIKSLAGAAISLSLSVSLSPSLFPSPSLLMAGLVVGAFVYGASIALYVRAQRDLGAARVAALFGCAPFVGALVSIPVLHETLTLARSAAGLLMAIGLWLLLREQHAHAHVHELVAHEHAHVHDEHHQHPSDGPVVEPHSHRHEHDSVAHSHPHAPDIHHRHGH